MRYNNHSGSGTGSSSNDFDDITLKLQKYSAIGVTGKRVNAFDSKYGDKLIVGFDDVEVLDGIVFQRDDNPDTWKVFSAAKFFNVDPDTGKVYETATEDDDGNVTYEDEMSAQDILEHPRVLGFSETFGGTDYFYTPIGAVVEATDDIATNDAVNVTTTDAPSIEVGEVSMLLSNKAWVRTLAKLVSEEGDDIIARTTNDQGEEVHVTDNHGWLTTMEPTLREGIEGRRMELFVIEETAEFEDGETTYTTPILLDSKTEERITIDNLDGDSESGDAEADADDTAQEAAAPVPDGGATTAEAGSDDTGTESPDTPTTADDDEDEAVEAEVPDVDPDLEDVPDVLDDLMHYFARTDGAVEPDELQEFAADEVDDPNAVNWEAAAAQVEVIAAEEYDG